MQQRYYDPAIGGFLSVDPVAVDTNTGANFGRYNYANNNPYRFTDPDGRAPQGCQRSRDGCGDKPPPPPPPPPKPPCSQKCMEMRATSDGKGNQRSATWEFATEISGSGKAEVDSNGKVKVEIGSNAFPPTLQTGVYVTQRPLDADGKVTPVMAAPSWFKPRYYGSGLIGIGVQKTYYFSPNMPGAGGNRWYFDVPDGQASHDNASWTYFRVYTEKVK